MELACSWLTAINNKNEREVSNEKFIDRVTDGIVPKYSDKLCDAEDCENEKEMR
jgi:hypothetical protein